MRPAEKPKRELVPKGNHVARMYAMYHFGHIKNEWEGKVTYPDMLRFSFELCNEKKVFKEGEEARPYSISTKNLTYTMGTKSHLRKLIEGMTGVALTDKEAYAFDPETLLGEPCLLNVVHKEGKNGVMYSNIEGASPLPKGMEAPPLANEKRFVDIDTATKEEIEELPEWLRDMFKSSDEYDKQFQGGKGRSDVTLEDIPF